MKPFLLGVHGIGVGAGIGLAIQAMQSAKAPNNAESWVQFCIKAAAEAYAVVVDDPPLVVPGSATKLVNKFHRQLGEPEEVEYESGASLHATAHAAATVAFRACMPHVTGRRNAQAFIACCAAGVQLHYIGGAEARSLLYTAQLALAASRSSRAARG